MNKLICTSCGHIGASKTITKGSILIEAVLWLCLLIPGLIIQFGDCHHVMNPGLLRTNQLDSAKLTHGS